MKKNNLKIAHFTSYLPKRCGIATYSAALHKSIEKIARIENYTIAINDKKEGYIYPPIKSHNLGNIIYNFWDRDKQGYIKAAQIINENDTQIVDIQHEFGLYGARVKVETLGKNDGKNFLLFLNHLKKPAITTLHMVYKNPPKHHADIVREICDKSKKVVVLSKIAKQLLVSNYYNINPEKIELISHGAPNLPKQKTSFYKELLGYSKETFIISSFGYIRSKKGYEYLIDAMPKIIDVKPTAKLLIIGETHPQRSPEYFQMLQEKVKKLKIESNVEFIDKFVNYSELLNYLMATNIFVAPFLVLDQVSSGTLIYAMAAGRACIATPFDYAKEALANKRGILVPPNNSKKIADSIKWLIKHPKARHTMENKAYKYARNQTWSIVAKKYIKLFNDIIKK